MLRFKVTIGITALLVGLFVAAVLSIDVREVLGKTEHLASWAVAAGTIVLAFATFELARGAAAESSAVREQATQVGEQVALQRRQLEFSSRPIVFPSAHDAWALGRDHWESLRDAVLPLTNGGPGVAMNISGRVVWNPQPGEWKFSELLGGSIGPGATANARLSPRTNHWANSAGFVRYSELSGDEWVTFFRIEREAGGQLVGSHHAPELVSKSIDPTTMDGPSIFSRAHGRQ